LIWGIGVLLPWNAVLSTMDFFDGETFKEFFSLKPDFVYAFAVNGLAVLVQIIVIIYGYKLSDRVKIQTGMFINAAIMLALPFTAHFISDPVTTFWACFVLLFIFGGVNGMVQCSVFASAGFLPG